MVAKPDDGCRERWGEWRAAHVLPWMKANGALNDGDREFSRLLRELAGLSISHGRLSAWGRPGPTGSNPDSRLTLERIAEAVGSPDPRGASVWIWTGVGDPPHPRPESDLRVLEGSSRAADLSQPTPAQGTRVSAMSTEEHGRRIKAAAALLVDELNEGGLRDEVGMRAYLALQEFSRGRSSVGRAAAFYPGEWSSDFVTAGSEIGGTASGPFTSPSTPLTAIILIPHMLDAA